MATIEWVSEEYRARGYSRVIRPADLARVGVVTTETLEFTLANDYRVEVSPEVAAVLGAMDDFMMIELDP